MRCRLRRRTLALTLALTLTLTHIGLQCRSLDRVTGRASEPLTDCHSLCLGLQAGNIRARVRVRVRVSRVTVQVI